MLLPAPCMWRGLWCPLPCHRCRWPQRHPALVPSGRAVTGPQKRVAAVCIFVFLMSPGRDKGTSSNTYMCPATQAQEVSPGLLLSAGPHIAQPRGDRGAGGSQGPRQASSDSQPVAGTSRTRWWHCQALHCTRVCGLFLRVQMPHTRPQAATRPWCAGPVSSPFCGRRGALPGLCPPSAAGSASCHLRGHLEPPSCVSTSLTRHLIPDFPRKRLFSPLSCLTPGLIPVCLSEYTAGMRSRDPRAQGPRGPRTLEPAFRGAPTPLPPRPLTTRASSYREGQVGARREPSGAPAGGCTGPAAAGK